MDSIIITIGGVGLALLIYIVVYARLSAAKRRQYASQLRSQFAENKAENNQFNVRYYSKEKFNKIFKIFPWEGYGVLNINNKDIMFIGVRGKKDKIKIVFPVSATKVKWIGKTLPNGPLSWFGLSYGDKISFFTSETGGSFLNSETLTREIYDQVTDRCR